MPRQGLTQEIIITQAIKIINLSGYSRLTFKLLSEKLNVKPPAMFRHFKNLDDLKRAITLKALKGLTQNLQLALIGISGRNAVVSLCNSYRKYVNDNKGLYNAIQPRFFKDKEISIAATGLMSIIISVLKGFNLEEKDHIHLVRLIRSSLHGFVTLETEYNFGIPVNIDASFKYQIEAILFMIKSFEN